MKQFFKPEDFKCEDANIGPNIYHEVRVMCANLANAKLQKEGVILKGRINPDSGGFQFLSKEDYIPTHTALLLNIQKIEEEKPRCSNDYHRLCNSTPFRYCPHCGQKLGGS